MAQPMYQQIADDIRRQIEEGELSRGKQLPTELELREKYDASRNTVRDAIKRLASLGLVETKPGQGTFVTQSTDPFITTLSTDPKTGFGGGEGASRLSALASSGPEEEEVKADVSVPRVEVQRAEPWMRRRLNLPEDNPQVIVRRQQRHIGEVPWSLQMTYYPMGFATQGATKLLIAEGIEPGTVSYLAETLGIKQIGYRDWIITRRPNEEEQRFFSLPQDSTVIEVFRTAYDQHKEPFRVTVSVFSADRNQLIYDVGDGLPEARYNDRPPADA